MDVEIKILESDVESLGWRKPSQSGLLLNFNSICPKTWKSGLIVCLLHRTKLICSSMILYNKEIKNLRKMFLRNGYPEHFFDVVVKNA